jgi:hypothetical protein
MFQCYSPEERSPLDQHTGRYRPGTGLVAAAWDVSVFHGPTHGRGGCSALAASIVSMLQCQVVSTWLVATALMFQCFTAGSVRLVCFSFPFQVVSTHLAGSVWLGCFSVSVPGCEHLAGSMRLGCFSDSVPSSEHLAGSVRLVCFSVSVPSSD